MNSAVRRVYRLILLQACLKLFFHFMDNEAIHFGYFDSEGEDPEEINVYVRIFSAFAVLSQRSLPLPAFRWYYVICGIIQWKRRPTPTGIDDPSRWTLSPTKLPTSNSLTETILFVAVYGRRDGRFSSLSAIAKRAQQSSRAPVKAETSSQIEANEELLKDEGEVKTSDLSTPSPDEDVPPEDGAFGSLVGTLAGGKLVDSHTTPNPASLSGYDQEFFPFMSDDNIGTEVAFG
ncbi:hypothetical protein M427DRAFT_45193 [Gonapodya prolifera JEL478]|uniref:Uncharacterized protein n=1 Tax=Gonapodya prolifera (strain JEL478) TaxID=1344416 RepID=A0A139AB91_GONPJ|nr:hypothetical protein M427DRAFT_45193 [Gonapodya prolifera JEL478]|eukprot:KXS14092.1 hypothetical protein M427DRAFT_45193 [Gonapodya prolifera JEL478]